MWTSGHAAYEMSVSEAFLLPRQDQFLISRAFTPPLGHANGAAVPECLSEDMEAQGQHTSPPSGSPSTHPTIPLKNLYCL